MFVEMRKARRQDRGCQLKPGRVEPWSAECGPPRSRPEIGGWLVIAAPREPGGRWVGRRRDKPPRTWRTECPGDGRCSIPKEAGVIGWNGKVVSRRSDEQNGGRVEPA
jgi:hypothetical protein